MTDTRDTILIYNDCGAANVDILKREIDAYFIPRGFRVAYTSAKDIMHGALNTHVRALFMPGGAARPFAAKLNGQGNASIRNFVRDGGFYYGICAGAYYACTHMMFEPDIPSLRKSDYYGLNLMNATAIGSLYKEMGLSPYRKNGASMACAILTGSDRQHYSAHYHGGPYFQINTEPAANIIANYQVAGNPIAVADTVYGGGRVILSGVHYETTGADILGAIHKSNPDAVYLHKVASHLTQAEPLRRALLNKVLDCCK